MLEVVVDDPLWFGVVVAGLYLVRPLFAWPTTPLAIVVGYGYGIPVGIVVATMGVVVTVTPVFVLARRFSNRNTEVAGGSVGGFDGLFDRSGTALERYYTTAGLLRGVIVSRLAPIPSDVATCAAAVSGVRLRQLLVGTAIGELPWTVAAVVVGASAGTIATDGLGDLGVVVTVVCLLAAGVLLAGPTYRVVVSRRSEETVRTGVDG